ncbi:MAG TPA: beta-ketoacyl-[acyl-carrier-protein] synthase family protein [Euzebya sp.]|nr:beta-ketoacyl-[acyl-carrier-protein] synthase family protein [Euzebya sp.]
MSRVVVTGLGVLTPLGTGAKATWEAVVAGRTAIGPLTTFDPVNLHTRQGAEISDFTPRDYADRRALKLMTREDRLAVAGATLAIEDSGLDLEGVEAAQVGLYLGGQKAMSDIDKLSDALIAARGDDGTATLRRLTEEGIDKIYPLFYVEGLQAAALFYISAKYGMKGPNCYFHGTADAGATAIGRAQRAIQHGEATVAVAGGFDWACGWWNMSRFDAMGVLSDRNDMGPKAIRPFDRDRTGTLMGEGAAFMVLESEEHARARDARPYAVLAGFGGGHDAGGQLTPDPEGRGLVAALRGAMRDAGGAVDRIDYVAAHGGGTIKGDVTEAVALRTVYGAGAGGLACSSVKPATGHLVAGAGALNAAVSVLAIHHGEVPPTLNLDNPDPACDLDFIPHEARQVPVAASLAIARGLEGQNVALVFTEV